MCPILQASSVCDDITCCYNTWTIGLPCPRFCSIIIYYIMHINSLAPGRFELNFIQAVFKLILVTGGWAIFCETTLRWMSLDLTDDKSTLVRVMAWCHQATSHYLSQCWPRSLTPYGITRPQWVNSLTIYASMAKITYAKDNATH